MQILLHAHAIFYESPRLPKIFLNDRLTNSNIHNHYTRSSSDFHRLQVSSTLGSRISFQLISKLCNLLPHNIKSTRDFSAFKQSITLFLLYNSIWSYSFLSSSVLFSFSSFIFPLSFVFYFVFALKNSDSNYETISYAVCLPY